MRARARPLFLRTVFQILCGFPNRTVKWKSKNRYLSVEIRFRISRSIGNPKSWFWKSKSGFPNRTHPKLCSTKVRQTLSNLTLLPHQRLKLPYQINSDSPRSFVVINSSVRFGTWVERRLNRALFICLSPSPFPMQNALKQIWSPQQPSVT